MTGGIGAIRWTMLVQGADWLPLQSVATHLNVIKSSQAAKVFVMAPISVTVTAEPQQASTAVGLMGAQALPQILVCGGGQVMIGGVVSPSTTMLKVQEFELPRLS